MVEVWSLCLKRMKELVNERTFSSRDEESSADGLENYTDFVRF